MLFPAFLVEFRPDFPPFLWNWVADVIDDIKNSLGKVDISQFVNFKTGKLSNSKYSLRTILKALINLIRN